MRYTKHIGLLVESGLVEGQSIFEKFGRNNEMDIASAPEDVFEGGGEYTGLPDTPDLIEIFSDNINDTNGGSGAWTVEVGNLLDENLLPYAPQLVTLNGTTPVLVHVSQQFLRNQRMRVISAGASGHNEGTITARHVSSPSTVFGFIIPTKNQTNIGIMTVPAGKTYYMKNILVKMARENGSNGSAEFAILAKPSDVPNSVFAVLKNPELTNSQPYEYKGEIIKVTEKTDLKLRVLRVSDNNTIVYGETSGKVIDN